MDDFWKLQTRRLSWIKEPTLLDNSDFKTGNISWFSDGTLNVSANCIDRHLATKGDQPAIIWEGDDPEKKKTITYSELSNNVNRFANVLKQYVSKGDRVIIYMPLIPEAAFAMLACARIGAIHSVVFGGFSSESLLKRITDCDASLVITADGGFRGGKIVPLKKQVDEIIDDTDVKHVLCIKHTGQDVQSKSQDLWYHDLIEGVSDDCEPVEMNSEDPLFVLYTSGSTGTPKGIVHSSGGYLVYANYTFNTVFDYKEGDVFWCTADVGWITGHSYVVYGPLSSGATIVMHEGTPFHPTPARHWEMVERYKVNTYYTAPTAIRALLREGDEHVLKSDLSSLKLLGSVGEPLNPEAWEWYRDVVGKGNCKIMDTWWQTETGGIMLAPLKNQKPGFVGKPLPGIKATVFDEDGKKSEKGMLCFSTSWPGQARTIYKNHKRFIETYFSKFPGFYYPADECEVVNDEYRIIGRVDDLLNVAGHLLGTAEIESALGSHEAVAESAVVGFPHQVKGEGIYAFVILKSGFTESDQLKQELRGVVGTTIGPIAKPHDIQFVSGLPKTRSGKIMRRILKKIVIGDEDYGDVSTLADPSVIDEIRNSKNST